MNCPRKPLPKRHLSQQRCLVRTIQGCTLGLSVFLATNMPRAQAASPAKSSETSAGQPANEIRAVLQTQQEAWNRGDMDAFLNTYARSVSTVFISGDTVTRGWQTVRARYKMKYRSRAKMGKLRFYVLKIQPLKNDAAVVFGRWLLKRATNDNPRGLFTLVFRRTSDGWRIVHDHTFTAAAPP